MLKLLKIHENWYAKMWDDFLSRKNLQFAESILGTTFGKTNNQLNIVEVSSPGERFRAILNLLFLLRSFLSLLCCTNKICSAVVGNCIVLAEWKLKEFDLTHYDHTMSCL